MILNRENLYKYYVEEEHTLLETAGYFNVSKNTINRRCQAFDIKKKCQTKRVNGSNFLKKAREVYGEEYSILSDYLGIDKEILVKHNECGYEYYTTPNNFTKKYGSCSRCRRQRRQDFLLGDILDRYEILDDYNNIKDKVRVKCKKCNEIFESSIHYLRRNKYCKKCLRHSHNYMGIEGARKIVSELGYGEYEVLSEDYEQGNSKLKMKHLLCGNVFDVSLNNFRSGVRCSKCTVRNSTAIGLESFKERVCEKYNGEYVVSDDEYITSKHKINVTHVKCGHTYKVSPNNFLKGNKCPKCSMNGTSQPKIDLKNWIQSLGDFKVESYHGRPYQLDIYIPEKKIGIEFNGTYWHSLKYKNKSYHHDKSKHFEEKGIRVIHIWEYEWNNCRQRPILENIIKNALGLNSSSVYARNCNVEIRESKDMRDFFNKNNIQGFRGGKFAICLINNGEVVMSYIMGSCFFGRGKYDWEVIRGATKLGVNVVGGASKIWKFFISNYNPNNCVYYIDYNYFNGNSLPHLGLRYITTQPGFKNWWVKENIIKNREPSKHKEIKSKIIAGEVIPVYNAGTKVYVWNKNLDLI